MNAANDGGPAYPVQDAAGWQYHGMTLRDYFAAKAMAALLQGAPSGTSFGTSPENHETNFNYAVVAYALADAMLKARG